jgi:hypothetical protein
VLDLGDIGQQQPGGMGGQRVTVRISHAP